MAKEPDAARNDHSSSSTVDSKDKDSTSKKNDEVKEVKERSSTSEHVITLNGKALPYRATAGTLVLRDDKGKPRASMFHIAYAKKDADPASRPITFVFNGGPGSAALWLLLGAFGPRRVDIPDALTLPVPPYRLVDNEQTLLDVTDLVFVDPVRTGYSTPEGEAKDEDFLGIDQDLKSVAELIRLYITRNNRWASAKLVAGESYGSMRAAGLLGMLHDQGMAFNGGILVSVVIDLNTLIFETHRDLPPILYLPSYAATAWYHNALPSQPPRLEPFLDEVRSFACNEYALALMKGTRLGKEEASSIARKLHQYTGLSIEYLERTKLRINNMRFCKELLRERGQTVGRLDSRVLGRDRDNAGEFFESDPAMTTVLAPFSATMQSYVRRELGFEEDRPYHAINQEANKNWKWSSEGRITGPSTAEPLRTAMLRNPHLHLFVANGYYDLATPFLAAEHTLDHLGMEPADLERVHFGYYEAGHMMYVHPPSRAKLHQDLLAFYAAAIPH